MRAVTISIGKFHIVLAAGKAEQISLMQRQQKDKVIPQPYPVHVEPARIVTLKDFPDIPDGTEVNLRG